jgi:hypothetical protein
LRGGSFRDSGSDLHASVRSIYDPTAEFDLIGFRVSEVPEPATIVILALASLGVLHRQRRDNLYSAT